MGAVLSGLEVIVMGGAIWNEAQTHIVESQIRSLWESHQKQIEAVATLYTQVDKMSFNDSLFAQLTTCSRYSIDNWAMIAKDITKQTNLINVINKDFQDTYSNRMSMTDSNYVGLGLTIFGFTLASIMFFSDVAPQQFEKVKASIKEGGKLFIEKVKLAGRKLRLVSVNEEGNFVEEQYISDDMESRINPESQNPKNKGKWSKGTIAMNFIRVGFLLYMIWGFIKGRHHIDDLRTQLQKDNQYFKDKGKFEKELQHCVDAIKNFVCDVSNLGEASRAVIEDLHTLYLTKAFVEGTSTTISAERADQLTTQKFDLTDSFIDRTKKLRDGVQKSDKDEKTLADKLQQFVTHFNTFYNVNQKQKSPDLVFLSVTERLSQVVSKDSVFNKDLFNKQSNLFSMAEIAQSEFKQKRKSKYFFDKKSPEEKAEIDKSILDVLEQQYKEIIIEDDTAQLRKSEKNTLAGILLNYCDTFYGTDKTGATIYELKIADLKSKITYAEIIEQKKHESQAENVPVQYDDKTKEEAAVKVLLVVAKDLAAGKGEKYQDVKDMDPNKPPQIEGRYLNLKRVATGETDKDVPKMKLVGRNGLKFKIRGDTYSVEQDIIGGANPTLVKAGVV